MLLTDTYSEAYERAQAIQRARDSVPLPGTIGELYDGKFLLPEYNEHRPAERAIRRYHRRVGEAVPKRDSLPVGVQQALKLPLIWTQIVNRYPWKVMWIRVDEEGRRRKGQKLCTTLGGAIAIQRRAAKKVPNATIISRVRGYDIPPSLRGKLPPQWYWCPRCMKPRQYKRHPDDESFYTIKKTWDSTKQKYKFAERKVWLLVCPMCSCTNRDPTFRRSNQPWQTRRIKSGVRRIRTTKKRRRRSA